MSLLRGDVRVTQALLDGPRIEATLDRNGRIEGLATVLQGLGGASRVIVERLVVSRGSGALVDEAGRAHALLLGLDLEADAGALAGPWRATGRGRRRRDASRAAPLHRAPEADGTRLKLQLVGDRGRQRAELDARVLSVNGRPSLDGRLTASGRARWPDRDAFSDRGWTFAAGLKIAGRAGVFEGIELDAGGDEAPVKFTGSGELDLGEAPRLKLALEAKQLDLDGRWRGPSRAASPRRSFLWAASCRRGSPRSAATGRRRCRCPST